jgi:hypothetical protein
MSRQPASFPKEVMERFQFLVDDHGLMGPDYSELLLPSVSYGGTGLRIGIYFQSNSRDGAGRTISVSISLDTERGAVHADLAELVEALTFAPRHRVAWKAHNADAMRSTLDDTATWLRRLLPILQTPDVLDTVRNFDRHPTDKAGNPKRRRPDIKWKYG